MGNYSPRVVGRYLMDTSVDAARLYFRPLKLLCDWADSPEVDKMYCNGLVTGAIKLFFYPLTAAV